MGVIVSVGVNEDSGRKPAVLRHFGRSLPGAMVPTAAAGLAILAASPAAYGSCDQVGANVSCTGTTFNYNSGAQANLNVTVQPDATVIGNGGNDAIRFTSTTDGTLTNNGVIDGFVTISSGNAGSDTFTNNGVLKITDPTANIQEHSMAGTNFSQTANGSFFARVDSAGFFDGILSWSAALNGKLVIVVQPGTYGATTTYTQFINTVTGTTGNFSSITSSSPFFTAALQPNGNNRDLILSFIGFGAVQAMTPNQKAVGAALEGSYDPNTVSGNAATFYSNLLAATLVTVFDHLSGEGIGAAQNASFGAGSQFNNAIQDQSLFAFNPSGLSVIVQAYAPSARQRFEDAFASAKKAPDEQQQGRWRIWRALGRRRDLARQRRPVDPQLRRRLRLRPPAWPGPPGRHGDRRQRVELHGAGSLDVGPPDRRPYRRLRGQDLERLLRRLLGKLRAI
jgi:hypothetical protein